MKKIFLILLVILFGLSSMAVAEETRSGVYIFDLTLPDTSIEPSGTSYFLVDGKAYNDVDYPLDLDMVKPNIGAFSLQVYEITPGVSTAGSNLGGTSPWQYSGVTYTIDYSTSIHDGVWSSGTTDIVTAIPLSGQSTEVVPFTPEFAIKYRLRNTSGITQYILKAKLIIQ